MNHTYCCILEQQYHMGESSSVFSRQLKLLSAVKCRCLQITQLLESVPIWIAPFIIRLLIGTYPDHLIHSMIYKQGWRQTGKAVIEGIPEELLSHDRSISYTCYCQKFLRQFALQICIHCPLNLSSLGMTPVHLKLELNNTCPLHLETSKVKDPLRA